MNSPLTVFIYGETTSRARRQLSKIKARYPKSSIAMSTPDTLTLVCGNTYETMALVLDSKVSWDIAYVDNRIPRETINSIIMPSAAPEYELKRFNLPNQ